VDAEGVRDLLRTAVAEAGSQTAWASRQSPPIASTTVSLTLIGRIDPPPKILRALGLRKMLCYEPVNDGIQRRLKRNGDR
jgi:hypothetical protein